MCRLCLGVAIGGACSAQEASLVLMRKERPLQSFPLPPILRYRDYYLVICQEPEGRGACQLFWCGSGIGRRAT